MRAGFLVVCLLPQEAWGVSVARSMGGGRTPQQPNMPSLDGPAKLVPLKPSEVRLTVIQVRGPSCCACAEGGRRRAAFFKAQVPPLQC